MQGVKAQTTKNMTNPNAQALGSLGGKARAKKLSPERRKEIAKIASLKATEARKNKT